MNIAQIILESALIILGFYLAFFKSYSEEKGKNLATKEDIAEITKKIENVKSEIQLLTDRKKNFEKEMRQSLLDYHSAFNTWYVNILENFPSLNILEQYSYEGNQIINRSYNEFIKLHAVVNIYYNEDESLIKAFIDLHDKVLDFESMCKNSLSEALSYNDEINAIPSIQIGRNITIAHLIKERDSKIHENYLKGVAAHEKLAPIFKEIRRMINERLRVGISEK